MIKRNLYQFLEEWKDANWRKPLILRGARQVGKTTLVKEFGKSYHQFLYFNLETTADRRTFEQMDNLTEVINEMFLSRNKTQDKSLETLIFIDEVQEQPRVIEQLRYFYEDFPHLHIIVSGSLLEFGMRKVQRVPVGRVQYANLYPLTFREYLAAQDGQVLIDNLNQIPFKNKFLRLYLDHFHEYTMIGGLPEVAQAFISNGKDLSKVMYIYEGISDSFISDVEKYATNSTQREVIRHIINTLPFEIDNRITFSNFGGSEYRNREVKEAFLALQSAQIVEVIYPTTATEPPAGPAIRKSPRLRYMDIGLLNYQLEAHTELLKLNDLNDATRGKLVQQVILQELKSTFSEHRRQSRFWVRQKKGASSEVDIVHQFKDKLIPIEVKSGATGTLRSLHEFIDRCPHHYAIRLYAGELKIDQIKTRKGKEYQLLNLPYFLAAQIDQYIEWFIENK